jgi:putative peptide zinc metalloprotease protein
MQLNAAAKAVADDLGQLPVGQLLAKHQISQPELIGLLQQLAQGSMLEGVPPPKRPKRKFTPLQLLFFKVPLFDPDPWLGWPAQQLGWLWTQPVFLLLCFGLGFSALVGFDQRSQLLHMGAALTQAYGATLFLPFGLLAVLVVTLHELGHALTLKHYGGIVPQMGLLFMMLLPAAYTDTTDQYFLTRRRQRILVVAAGVIVQLLVAAIALWLWKLSAPNSWLHPTSYLLLVAALFTLALNLNPLARFDGYYFMVAVTGINCLKDRAIKLYTHWFAGRPSGEQGRDRWILATYAPFSLLYTLLIFGSIVLLILHQFLANAPVTLGLLLAIWAIYYFLWPDPATQS